MLIPDTLNLGIARYADQKCFELDGRSFTFAELDRRADRMARLLHENGVVAGDRIAFLGKNELEFAELQIGAQRAGAIFVPMNYRLSVRELEYVVQDCAPKLLFVGPEHEEAGGQLVQSPILLHPQGPGSDYLDTFDAGAAAPPNARMRDGDALAQLLYTSGTTGFPKGVMVTNAALHVRMMTYAFELNIRAGDAMIQTLPMFHLTSTFAYAHLLFGASVVLVRKVNPADIWALVRRNQGTCLKLVPTVLDVLLVDEAEAVASGASLRSIIYGASSIMPDLLEKARRLFPNAMMNMYGLTEAGAATVVRPVDHDVDRYPGRIHSVGFDMVNYETAIMSEALEVLPVGQPGEICIRGPGMMAGYWGDPASAERIDHEGWIRTGDGGVRAADGTIILTDRLKDMIVTGGENVFSVEVERVLSQHPDVQECAVIAVTDPRLGERVHAVIVPAPDCDFDLTALDAHCRTILAGYKRPRSWTILDQLPRNAIGKVSKVQLRKDIAAEFLTTIIL